MIKKFVSSVLLLVSVCLLFGGCHGSKSLISFEVPEVFDDSKQYTVTFWAKNDTNVNQTRVYENAIKSFESLYPNIKIDMRLYTDYSKIYNDVITNISTGTTPNVCITYPDHIATYLTGSNCVAPLDSLFESEKYGFGGSELRYESPKKNEVVTKYLDECKFDGFYYAIPFMRSTEACYINKDYVEKLGYEVPEVLTWDFMFEVAEKACETDFDGNYKVNGQKVLLPIIYKSSDNMMIQMLFQKGAGYSDNMGNISIFNDDTAEILTSISRYTKDGTFSTFKISGYPANFLNAGQCIFAIDSTAGSTWMGSDAPLVDISEDRIVEFETVVRTVPQYDVDNIKIISQGPSICVFNKDDPQQVLASWMFAQYLLTNDVQIAYSETEGYVPVTLNARNDADYISYLSSDDNTDAHYSIKLDATKMLIDNTDNTFVTPVFNGSASLREAAGQMIEDVVKSTRRKQIIDDNYISTLFNDMVSLYRLDGISGSKANKDLGPLPSTSIILLICIGTAWFIMGIYILLEYIKRRKTSRK